MKRVRDMTRTYNQMQRIDNYSEHSSIIWPVWLNRWVFVCDVSDSGFQSSYGHLNFRFHACFEQGVSWHSCKDIYAFTLELVREKTRTYSQTHRTDNNSERSSIIWPVWLNGSRFFYKISGSGFKSSWSNLNFRFCSCQEEPVRWQSGKYRVWIHSETFTWHVKNIRLNATYR